MLASLRRLRALRLARSSRSNWSPWPCNSAIDVKHAGKDGFVAANFSARQLLVGFWDKKYARDQKLP